MSLGGTRRKRKSFDASSIQFRTNFVKHLRCNNKFVIFVRFVFVFIITTEHTKETKNRKLTVIDKF